MTNDRLYSLGDDAAELAVANAVVGSGAGAGTHGTTPEDMWLTAGSIVGFGGPDFDPSITFDLDGLFDVNTLRIWNFNEAGFTQHGTNEIAVSAGATLATLTQLQSIGVVQGGGTGGRAGTRLHVSSHGCVVHQVHHQLELGRR